MKEFLNIPFSSNNIHYNLITNYSIFLYIRTKKRTVTEFYYI